ncbi:tudor and KH domain-containing protein homolog [Agrilus planipennis]|uniref:Tudor and KH domain-containing protein homolog n=1 Tax=Agrilus planipennis TaxID=224129 RepID=A0A1W4WRY2_AGRPL|nr:tudor and KH domain-containing protein homolog [Agrilus planipennis]
MQFVNPRIAATILGLSICASYVVYLLYKRDDDDDDIDGSLPIRANYKTLEVKIPKPMVNVLIGRNGKNIKSVEAETNTRIHFKDSDEHKEQICIVKGKADDCYRAENIIQEFLSNQTIIECDEMWIEQQYIGKIIGRCGEQITDIIARSGAKVNVSDGDRYESTRRIIIKGSKSQIDVAKSLINEIVEKCQSRQSQLDESLSRREPRLPPKAPSPNPSEALGFEKISPSPGQSESPFEVYVSAMIDPSHFWVQIVGPKATELDQLVEEMTEYYNNPNNVEFHILQKVEPGDLVAALFPYDSKWYRAEVLAVHAENGKEPHAELYFLDYGDTDVCPSKSIYELRTDFLRLHFQAIECYLARVEPAGECWSDEAIDYFEECTHVAQWKKLSARINGYHNRQKTRAKREVSPVPGLDLYDVVNNQDLNVAQNLVEHGYAVFKEDEGRSSRASSINNVNATTAPESTVA